MLERSAKLNDDGFVVMGIMRKNQRTSRVRRGRPDARFEAEVASPAEIADATMFKGEKEPCNNRLDFVVVAVDCNDRTPVKADAGAVDERRPLTASSPERRNNRPVNCFMIAEICDE